jgi:hypothetical protein
MMPGRQSQPWRRGRRGRCVRPLHASASLSSHPAAGAADDSQGVLPNQITAVRARCERTAVERGRLAFDEEAEFGSAMPVLSVGVRWGCVPGWVCKPEVTGSIPVRSTEEVAAKADVSSPCRSCASSSLLALGTILETRASLRGRALPQPPGRGGPTPGADLMLARLRGAEPERDGVAAGVRFGPDPQGHRCPTSSDSRLEGSRMRLSVQIGWP